MADPDGDYGDYWDGRFHEFVTELGDRGRAGWWFRVTGCDGALERARRAGAGVWDPVAGGWRFLLSWMSDSELLAVPGIGRRRLRAIRAVAPRSRWACEPGGEPHRDRLRPPPPNGRHPWWLLP